MLSQHQCSLVGGCESRTAASRHHSLAFPPHPQVLLAGFCSGLQHQLGVLSPPAPIFLKQHTTSAADYGVSHWSQYSKPRQTTKEVDRRRMTRMSTHSTPQPPPRTIHFTIPTDATHNTSFTFIAQPHPAMILHFPPRLSPPRPRKRVRAVTDVDGELSTLHKKKRRLRLFLITSRLSPEFSSPATNIVDRGSSKIAVWAKQKALGRNLLRKAAILNHIRWRTVRAKETEVGLRVLVDQEREQKQLELAKLAFVYGSHDTHTRPVLQKCSSLPPGKAVRVGGLIDLPSDLSASSRSATPSPQPPVDEIEAEAPIYRSPNADFSYSPPKAQIPRRSYLPLPPSPLGLSNYDAFDLEDDIPNPYSHLDDEDEEDQSHGRDEDLRDSDPRSPSAGTSASYTSTLSTVATGESAIVKTPPQMIYSDFNILDYGDPVVGDYDQIDEGADAIWPTTALVDASPGALVAGSSSLNMHCDQPVLPASSSPNFTALFATVKDDNDSTALDGSLHDYPLRPASGTTFEIAQERERQKSFMFTQFHPSFNS